MKILILGASQVGVSIAEVLVGEENDVTIVDVNNDVLQQLQNRLDIRTVTGSAAQPSVLRAAGAEDASLILAVTNNDQVNLVACQIAHLKSLKSICLASKQEWPLFIVNVR